MIYQIGAIVGMLRAEGMKLNPVKTHGYLWKLCHDSEEHCRAVIEAIKVFDAPILVIVGTRQESVAREMGVSYVPEFYPDLCYEWGGSDYETGGGEKGAD